MVIFLSNIDRTLPTNNKSSEYSLVNSNALPALQQRFVNIIIDERKKFHDSINEIQQTQSRQNRKLLIKDIFSDNLKVNDWIGTIGEIKTTTDGKASLTIIVLDRILFKTYNNQISDINYNTLISKDSDLYKTLSSFKHGDEVIFSGLFFSSKDDHITESSLTVGGSMKSPEFLMYFTNLRRK